MTAEDKITELFRTELEAADTMRDMLVENDEGVVEEAAFSKADELLDKMEDENRIRVVFATCIQIAQAIGSQELAEFGAKGLEKLNDGPEQ